MKKKPTKTPRAKTPKPVECWCPVTDDGMFPVPKKAMCKRKSDMLRSMRKSEGYTNSAWENAVWVRISPVVQRTNPPRTRSPRHAR